MPDVSANLRSQLEQLLGIQIPAVELKGVSADSRRIKSDDCFLALSGHQVHGSSFNDLAIANGASLILSDTHEPELHGQHSELASGVCCILVCGLNQLAGPVAGLFYNQPSHLLSLIGVTGTNGKTSVCEMICQLAGSLMQNAGYIGTLGVKYQGKTVETGMTTPDAVSLQAYLGDFVDHGCKLAAIEVSSHAAIQNRSSGCQFKTLAFTNLSHDHLDYHQTMQAYFEAKASLFINNLTATHVININSLWGQKLVEKINQAATDAVIISVGKGADAFSSNYLKLKKFRQLSTGFVLNLEAKIGSQKQSFEFELPLLAEFNIDNALVAIASLLSLDFDTQELAGAASQLKPVAGRMEVFTSAKNINLIVDFAHTPDGLEQALTACRNHCSGQLWVVFGCGGDRDKQKRAPMGEIADRLADKIVITNDNPRSESQSQIVAEISSGIKNKDYLIEFERKQAIKMAYQQAQTGDCILIAGKGHETYQEFSTGKVDYNERVYVANLAMEAV